MKNIDNLVEKSSKQIVQIYIIAFISKLFQYSFSRHINKKSAFSYIITVCASLYVGPVGIKLATPDYKSER